jgi:hypothetical protein
MPRQLWTCGSLPLLPLPDPPHDPGEQGADQQGGEGNHGCGAFETDEAALSGSKWSPWFAKCVHATAATNPIVAPRRTPPTKSIRVAPRRPTYKHPMPTAQRPTISEAMSSVTADRMSAQVDFRSRPRRVRHRPAHAAKTAARRPQVQQPERHDRDADRHCRQDTADAHGPGALDTEHAAAGRRVRPSLSDMHGHHRLSARQD